MIFFIFLYLNHLSNMLGDCARGRYKLSICKDDGGTIGSKIAMRKKHINTWFVDGKGVGIDLGPFSRGMT